MILIYMLVFLPVGSLSQDRSDEVTVGMATDHFLRVHGYEAAVKGCNADGHDIQCSFVDARGQSPAFREADALVYHIPFMQGPPLRGRGDQLLIGWSVESSSMYPRLDDQGFMGQFDMEMTYRSCSQVQMTYFDLTVPNTTLLFAEPVPYKDKISALVFLNTNCNAQNGRQDIVRELMTMNLSFAQVHSYGRCLRNMPVQTGYTGINHHEKIALFRRYKFCIVMENSNTRDYITEKIWAALESGCLPVYWGAPNVNEYLPDPMAVINYYEVRTPRNLSVEVARLLAYPDLYEAKMAWKRRPITELPVKFQQMVASHSFLAFKTRCEICRLVRSHKLSPVKHTGCASNQTWQMLTGSGTHR
jgi:Glycosyltransferase family 10 (fucosyltransferase) C-term